MVWGAIKNDGTKVLFRCNCSVDSIEYQRILTIGLPQIYRSRNIFQQDGATCHTSVSTKLFFENRAIRMLITGLHKAQISILLKTYGTI